MEGKQKWPALPTIPRSIMWFGFYAGAADFHGESGCTFRENQLTRSMIRSTTFPISSS